MKSKVILIFVCLFLMAASWTETTAQHDDNRHMKREQLAEAQAKHIAKGLKLDEEKTKRFVDTYCECQKSMWALGAKYRRANNDKQCRELTEEEIKAEFKKRFAQSRDVIDIREKYYKKYSSFLTQKQIKKMYELERQGMDRLMKHQNGPGGRQMQKKK